MDGMMDVIIGEMDGIMDSISAGDDVMHEIMGKMDGAVDGMGEVDGIMDGVMGWEVESATVELMKDWIMIKRFSMAAQHRNRRVYTSTQGSAQHRATHGATRSKNCKTSVQLCHWIPPARNIRAY